MAQLVVVKGPLAGEAFDLDQPVVIGRSLDCQVRLDDLTVSRVHARVSRAARGFIIEDMHSGNGTFVNQDRIQEPVVLRDEDTVRISGHVFKFVERPAGKKKDISSSTLVAIEDRPPASES